MNSITIYLFQVLNREKKGSSDYVIADYLLHHLSETSSITTDSLAEACHVSKASISRFCRKIGLNDFFELRYLLSNYYIETDKKFKIQTQTRDYVSNYVDDMKIKAGLLDKVEREVLNQLVEDLYQYKNVVLMGHMQSCNVAHILQQDLTPLKKIVQCTDDFTEQKEALLSEDEDTLVIAFSTSGEILKRILSRRYAAKKSDKPKVYLISTYASTKDAYADVHINLDSEDTYISRNIMLLGYANLIALGYKEKISQS